MILWETQLQFLQLAYRFWDSSSKLYALIDVDPPSWLQQTRVDYEKVWISLFLFRRLERESFTAKSGRLSKSRVEHFAVADIDIQVATKNGRLYQLEDIQELKRSQVIAKSSTHLQICTRVLENNLWKKTNLPREGSCVTGANSAGFEIIMGTTTGESINCRAKVSGMIEEDEFLQKIQTGELKCLLLGFTRQTFRQFLMIVERGLEGTVRQVGIMSVILPRQDLNLLALSKDKHLFCFE